MSHISIIDLKEILIFITIFMIIKLAFFQNLVKKSVMTVLVKEINMVGPGGKTAMAKQITLLVLGYPPQKEKKKRKKTSRI